MSSSVAPLFPKTSVFIPAFWNSARGGLLTQEEADALYLKFPVGQGTESIPNLIVSGSSTLGSVSASTFSQSGTYTNTNSGTPAKQVIINNTTPSITITDGTNTNIITPTSSGAVGTLQQVLDTGNSATGANAKIGLTNTDVGYNASPQITLNNSRSDAGASVGVPSIEYYKSGRNVVANDIVGSNFYYGKNYVGTKTLFGKIECVATTTGLNNDDGALDFYSCVNGVNNLVFRLNGADNENNSFRPFDINGNAIKTSQTNITIDATASSGTGQILIQPKTGTNLTIATTPAGANKTTINPDGTNMTMANTSSTFISTIQFINNAIASTYLYLSQNYGSSLIKSIYLLCSSSAGNSLESRDSHTQQYPFKIKVDNSTFSNSNSSLEIDMNPANDANVLAQLTFTHDNTLVATSFTADHYIPVLIAGTQYYIPITTSPS